MVKKSIIIIIVILQGLAGMAQSDGKKLDIGIGVGYQQVLNFKNVRLDRGIFYPSLYGNLDGGKSISAYGSYRLAERVWVGVRGEAEMHSEWSGSATTFIIDNPDLSIVSLSVNGTFIPRFQSRSFAPFYWGYYLAPTLNYQILSGDAIRQEQLIEEAFTTSYIKPGLDAGFSMFLEYRELGGLRLDIFYSLSMAKSTLFLDRSFHALNLSCSCYFRL